MVKENFKLSIAALSFIASAGLASCSSESDSIQGTTITDSSVLQSDEDAYSLADGALYNYFHKAYGQSFIVETFTSKTTSFEGPESEAGPLISRHDIDGTNTYFISRYDHANEAISAANSAIEKIEASGLVSESARNEAIGRAKIARVLGYHMLVRLFGEVPLYTSSSTSDVKTRASIDDIYTQITGDLIDAAHKLPATASLPSTPTKDAAYALLSRVYLDWGNNPLTYDQVNASYTSQTDPAVSYNTARLEKAVEYADSVTHHTLQQDFSKIWGKDNEKTNVEKILTFVHDGDAVGNGNHQTHCSWTFGFDWTQENHLSPSSDDFLKSWDKADQRRNVSYIDSLYDSVGDSLVLFRPPYTLPRYGKFVDRTSEGPNECFKLNDLDRIEIRYAEVLLNKAEALVELGRNEEAAEPYNEIRERAFQDKAHNKTAPTLQDIKNEWAYEFVYEQKEWYNLTRWKDLIKDLESVKNLEYFDDSYKTAGAIGRNGYVVNEFFAKTYKHLHAKYDNRRVQFYRFPIPVTSEGADRGITPQNPGY